MWGGIVIRRLIVGHAESPWMVRARLAAWVVSVLFVWLAIGGTIGALLLRVL